MNTKKCPYCSEEILETAKKCRFCGEFIDEDLRRDRKNEENEKPVQEIIVQKKNSGLVTFILVLIAIILVVALLGV